MLFDPSGGFVKDSIGSLIYERHGPTVKSTRNCCLSNLWEFDGIRRPKVCRSQGKGNDCRTNVAIPKTRALYLSGYIGMVAAKEQPLHARFRRVQLKLISDKLIDYQHPFISKKVGEKKKSFKISRYFNTPTPHQNGPEYIQAYHVDHR